MKIIDVSQLPTLGLPLYEMKEMFQINGDFSNAKISVITIPDGVRIPVEGTGCHEEDEYSFFIDGEVFTQSGDTSGIIKKGMATLIPKGEQHWCQNQSGKPCTLVCVMVK